MVFTSFLLIAIAVFSTFIYFYIRWSEERNRKEYARRNVPYVPQRNAFLQVITKERAELPKHEFIQQKGKVFGFNFLNCYTILVAEPELAQLVLSKEFTNFPNRRKFETDDPVFKYNIFFVRDEQWKRIRAVITPTFTTAKLRRMKPLIDDTVRTLFKNIDAAIAKDANNVNMKQLYGAFTMDTIIQVGFGIKVDSLVDQDNPIIAHAKRLFSVDLSLKNIFTFTMVVMLPKVANALKLRINGDVTSYFYDFSMKIIKQKRSEIKGNFGIANNFIDLLLEAEVEEELGNGVGNGEVENHKNGSTANGSIGENGIAPIRKFITNEEIVAQCTFFFLAGYDSTATTLTLASYLLSVNPETQTKLYQEIQSVIEKLVEEAGPNGPKDPVELVTLESLSRFDYLNAVVNETLRLYSPATFTERAVSKDMTLETEDGRLKINVKKGDVVQFPIYSMHRDPEQFPKPEKFDPERFIGSPTFHKYSYLPFGSGPRNCVAKSLALMEAKLALLHTVRLYKLTVCPQTNIPPEFYFNTQVMVPRDIILNVQKR